MNDPASRAYDILLGLFMIFFGIFLIFHAYQGYHKKFQKMTDSEICLWNGTLKSIEKSKPTKSTLGYLVIYLNESKSKFKIHFGYSSEDINHLSLFRLHDSVVLKINKKDSTYLANKYPLILRDVDVYEAKIENKTIGSLESYNNEYENLIKSNKKWSFVVVLVGFVFILGGYLACVGKLK